MPERKRQFSGVKKFFSFIKKDDVPEWEKIPVTFTPDATAYIEEILKREGNPESVSGPVAAIRLIQSAARSSFGLMLKDPSINPLSKPAIQLLIDKGRLDLSAENILREVKELKEENKTNFT